MMATDKTPQPLQNRMAIVNPDGTPTDYFIRWAQERQKAILDTTDAAQVEAIAEDVLAARKLIGGVGIDVNSGPEAFLSSDVTIDAKIQELLDLISSTRGSVLYRGATDWAALAPGTAGQVLSTNGAGADPSWIAAGGGGGGALALIGSVTTTAGQATVTFAAIPATYKHLKIIGSHGSVLNNGTTTAALRARFNSDTGATQYGFTQQGSYAAGTVFGNGSTGASSAGVSLNNSSGTAGVPFTNTDILISDYLSGNMKVTIGNAGGFQGNVGPLRAQTSGYWKGTAAITQIDIIDGNGNNFLTGSKFDLYGVS